MKKKAKKKIHTYSDNSIHLEFEEHQEGEWWITRNITLDPKTSISIFTDNTHFIWEGDFKGQTITVSLPRQTSEENASITNLPNKVGLRDQVISELKRILRQLN